MELSPQNDREDGFLLDETAAPKPLGGVPEQLAAAPQRRPLPLGYIAFTAAVVLAIAEGIAISLAYSNQQALAASIGQVLVVLSALPLALGLFVAIRGPRREWGIAAMVVAIVANPLILINVLSFFGTF